MLEQSKTFTNSLSPPAHLQVEIAATQTTPQLCPLLPDGFCLLEDSTSVATQCLLCVCVCIASCSVTDYDRSYLPKIPFLFPILEFAVAQRKPLLGTEIHSYTNQIEQRQQYRLSQMSNAVIVPLLCRDCSLSGRGTDSPLMYFPSLHNVTFHLFRNYM